MGLRTWRSKDSLILIEETWGYESKIVESQFITTDVISWIYFLCFPFATLWGVEFSYHETEDPNLNIFVSVDYFFNSSLSYCLFLFSIHPYIDQFMDDVICTYSYSRKNRLGIRKEAKYIISNVLSSIRIGIVNYETFWILNSIASL